MSFLNGFAQGFSLVDQMETNRQRRAAYDQQMRFAEQEQQRVILERRQLDFSNQFDATWHQVVSEFAAKPNWGKGNAADEQRQAFQETINRMINNDPTGQMGSYILEYGFGVDPTNRTYVDQNNPVSRIVMGPNGKSVVELNTSNGRRPLDSTATGDTTSPARVAEFGHQALARLAGANYGKLAAINSGLLRPYLPDQNSSAGGNGQSGLTSQQQAQEAAVPGFYSGRNYGSDRTATTTAATERDPNMPTDGQGYTTDQEMADSIAAMNAKNAAQRATTTEPPAANGGTRRRSGSSIAQPSSPARMRDLPDDERAMTIQQLLDTDADLADYAEDVLYFANVLDPASSANGPQMLRDLGFTNAQISKMAGERERLQNISSLRQGYPEFQRDRTTYDPSRPVTQPAGARGQVTTGPNNYPREPAPAPAPSVLKHGLYNIATGDLSPENPTEYQARGAQLQSGFAGASRERIAEYESLGTPPARYALPPAKPGASSDTRGLLGLEEVQRFGTFIGNRRAVSEVMDLAALDSRTMNRTLDRIYNDETRPFAHDVAYLNSLEDEDLKWLGASDEDINEIRALHSEVSAPVTTPAEVNRSSNEDVSSADYADRAGYAEEIQQQGNTGPRSQGAATPESEDVARDISNSISSRRTITDVYNMAMLMKIDAIDATQAINYLQTGRFDPSATNFKFYSGSGGLWRTDETTGRVEWIGAPGGTGLNDEDAMDRLITVTDRYGDWDGMPAAFKRYVATQLFEFGDGLGIDIRNAPEDMLIDLLDGEQMLRLYEREKNNGWRWDVWNGLGDGIDQVQFGNPVAFHELLPAFSAKIIGIKTQGEFNRFIEDTYLRLYQTRDLVPAIEQFGEGDTPVQRVHNFVANAWYEAQQTGTDLGEIMGDRITRMTRQQ